MNLLAFISAVRSRIVGFVWLFSVSLWCGLRGSGIRVPRKFFPMRRLERKATNQLLESEKISALLVMIDFSGFSLSFDVADLLASANATRANMGLKKMHVAFISDDNDPMMDDHHATVNYTDRRYRSYIFDVAIGSAQLFDFVGDVHFFSNRAEAEHLWKRYVALGQVFPTVYTPYRPDYMSREVEGAMYGTKRLFADGNHDPARYALRPPALEIDLVQQWLSQNVHTERIITVTLREAPYETERNSSIAAWQTFINTFDQKDVTFVVLRDFYKVFEPPILTGANVVACPFAVLDVPFRAALYHLSHLNLLTACGPASLCFLNKNTRYLIFLPSPPGTASEIKRVRDYHGIAVGENFIASSPLQRIVWGDEEPKAIIDATRLMLADIETS